MTLIPGMGNGRKSTTGTSSTRRRALRRQVALPFGPEDYDDRASGMDALFLPTGARPRGNVSFTRRYKQRYKKAICQTNSKPMVL